MRIAFTHNLQTSDAEAEAEFDTPQTVRFLTEQLEAAGHEVFPVEVSCPTEQLCAQLNAIAPDVVFNTAEGTTGRSREAHYASLFEQLGLAFTGPDAYGCVVSLDKRLTKLLARTAGVSAPAGRFIQPGSDVGSQDLTFPVIIKPNYEGSSKGITRECVAHDAGSMDRIVRRQLQRYPEGVLVERFIEGVDVAVPWIEGLAPRFGGALSPIGYRLPGQMELGAEAVYDYQAKHHDADAVSVEVPARLDEAVLGRLREATAAVCRVLGLRDVARADWRVTPEGQLWLLEVNALPSFEEGAGLYAAAALEGLATPSAVLDHLVSRAAARARPQPRAPAIVSSEPGGARVGLVYNLRRADLHAADAEAEFDSPETVQAIANALGELGHRVVPIEADEELVERIKQGRIDVVFNIAEGRRGRARESQVPAVLEMLGVPYTGSDTLALAVTLDKAMAKTVVMGAGVRTAPWTVLRHADDPLPDTGGAPMVIKPLSEGSSKGVGSTSVVHDGPSARALAAELIARYRQPVLAEAYLEGREFTVGILDDGTPRAMRPMEIVFAADMQHPVYTYEHKLTPSAAVTYEVPARVGEALERELCATAVAAHRALGCRDVSRVDLRLDAAGMPRFIECNPLPGLSPGWSDLAIIAEAEGMAYRDLIAAILAPALARVATGQQPAAEGAGPTPRRAV
jgi:D-alanine-D-alanine ligase